MMSGSSSITLKPQPNNLPAVQEPLQWLRDNAIEARSDARSRHFFSKTAIRQHFTYARLLPILDALLPKEIDHRLVASRILNSGENSGHGYLLVFLILLRIHRAQYIVLFLRQDFLSDQYLPIRNGDDFPSGVTFGAFRDHQWPFCPPTLTQNMDRDFRPEYILPIVEKRLIKSNDNATIYRISVLREFDHLASNNANVGLPTYLNHDFADKESG
jgi:hypothetical protein